MDLEILRQVQRPSRYVGGEVNQIKKDLSRVSGRVGLCYPDTYEIGMSHIGLKILYEVLNRRPEIAAERVYAPWTDLEAILRAKGQLLSTLENQIPLRDLHVLGFTLQYELSYSNLVNILSLGGIPVRAATRGPDDPVVIGGGPCAFNPEPLAAVLDAVCLGDGEDLLTEVVLATLESKSKRESRLDLWIRLAAIQGVYVPGLYDVHYNTDGTVAAVEPKHGAPSVVKKRTLMDLDKAPYFTKDLVPNTEIIHDRYGVEVQRGCMRGCRFCQAGYIYRPERQRSPETIRGLVREGLKSTGVDTYGLLSLSLGDYNCIEPLLLSLMDEHSDRRSAISTPSMRLESVTPAILDQIGRVRRAGFTVAPEAGTNRMRAVINKVVDEDVLLAMVGQLFSRGWRTLKLYFMIGLPTETMDDVMGIVDLAARCRKEARHHCRSPTITVSVSSFVPKSHTPFQWCPQISLEEIREKQAVLFSECKKAHLKYRNHEATSTIMEGVYSRGDRRTGEALIRAVELGARMDGWQEHHDMGLWERALAEKGLSRDFYNRRRRDIDETLPWDHLSSGVDKEWLWDDWMLSLEAGEVPDCSEDPCYDCGVCDHEVIHNAVFAEDAAGAKPKHRVKKRYIMKSAGDLVRLPSLKGRKKSEPQPLPDPTREVIESLASDLVPERDEAGADLYAAVFDLKIPVERRMRVRVRYAKRGAFCLLGHLEVMTQLLRALKRAELPVLFTAGHHPRMKTAQSPPVPVGVWSEAEYLDVDLKRPSSAEALMDGLSRELPKELVVLEAQEISLKAKAISAALSLSTWRVEPPEAETANLLRLASTWPSVLAGTPPSAELEKKVLGFRPSGRAFEVDLQPEASLRRTLTALFGTDPLEGGFRLTKIACKFDPQAEHTQSAGSCVKAV